MPSPTTGGILTTEQRAKLQSELDVVQSNMAVFGEMLSEMQPGQEQPDELELLQVNLLIISLRIALINIEIVGIKYYLSRHATKISRINKQIVE